MRYKLMLLISICLLFLACEEKSSPTETTPEPPPYSQLIAKECAFIATLQVTEAGDSDFGGMREGEKDGDYTYLWDIIQTDNTTESIWVWSYNRHYTGDTTYDQNIADAWTYVESHPGPEEEGGTSPISGYYRVYVSAWGPIAVMEYENSFSNASHRAYGDLCADYIAENPLEMTWANIRVRNTQVQAFAAGSLYLYAQKYSSDPRAAGWKAAALEAAEIIKLVVEEHETQVLDASVWAMSGGAIIWGLCNSYFLEHPDEASAWISHYAPMMCDYEPSGNWSYSHNAWYALGHMAAYQVTNDDALLTVFLNLRQLLLDADTDDDGGIPSTEGQSDQRDESWTSNYQVYMTFVPGIGY